MSQKTCNTLEEVRSEIDKIDNQIIELMAERNSFIKQAAHFKESVEEVKAPDRVEYVLERVRHKSLTLGLNPHMVTELYNIMIEEMVESEIAQFRDTKGF
jgi:isochorismate pyruvate lyase